MLDEKAWISISIPVHPEAVVEVGALKVHLTKLIKPHFNGSFVHRDKVILDLPKTVTKAGSTQFF